ncbi:MAG: HD domain-containing protein [Phycisphaerae bacterium]
MTNYDFSRQCPDPQESFFANPLLLDRHRVLHSTSFRRLGYKTQVFLPLEADHLRTRLTHTLEVAHLAGLLADHFGVNTALAEVISLAHDLGHGPFGHSSEKILNLLLEKVGGFEHNHQSLRVVQYLEGPYPWFRGLNLTHATLAGLEVHNTPYDRPDALDTNSHIEGQLANWADRLAYNTADLEDALGAGFLIPDDLKNLALYRQSCDQLDPSLRDKPLPALRRIILESIQIILIQSLEIQRPNGSPMVTINGRELQALRELESFLLEKVYRNPQLARTSQTVQEIIAKIFHRYQQEPRLLPTRYLSRQGDLPLDLIIGDYISGMTDRFCLKVYRQMFGPDDILLASIEPVVGLGSI